MPRKHDTSEELTALGKYLRNKIRHRDDFYLFGKHIIKSNKTTASVEDIIEYHWKKDELKPLIIKKEHNEEKNRITYIIHLPAHIRFADFVEMEEYFRDATNCSIEITQQKGGCILDIYTKDLEMPIPYKWDYEKYNKMILPLPLGYTLSGNLKVYDLVNFPHFLVSGSTLYGKSNLLHVLVNSLLESRGKSVIIIVIDLKKLDFGYLRKKGCLVVTEEDEVEQVLYLLTKEMYRRINILQKLGYRKIQTYHNNKNYQGDMPYVVVMFDELLEINDQKRSQESLYKLIRVGRTQGFHFILSVLRPSHKAFKNFLFTDLRSQLGGRTSFWFPEKKDIRMVVDSGRNHYIEPIAGRFIFCYDKPIKLQAMYLPPDEEQRNSDDLPSDFPVAMQIPYNIPKLEGGIIPNERIKSQKMLPPR